MTIALPGSSKFGLSGLLGRKRQNGRNEATKTTTPKRLKPEDVARRFAQGSAPVKDVKPAKLNDSEKQDRDRISSLRGALYSKD